MISTVDESLICLASNEKLLKLCEMDIKLLERYRKSFEDDELKMDFDPILTAACNPNLCTAFKGKGKFDPEKFTRTYLLARMNFLNEKKGATDPLTSGFDFFAYFMNYEDEIQALYPDENLSKMHKSCLHFIELRKEEKEVDYLRYMASYDDIIKPTLRMMPDDIAPLEWLTTTAKDHYETIGKNEILSGVREIPDLFDPYIYIASYAGTKNIFWNNSTNELDEKAATVAFIVTGFNSGLKRDIFDQDVYLANYPENLMEDIFVEGSISKRKVAKVWLRKFPEETTLSKFDPMSFAEAHGIDDPFKSCSSFVGFQANKYMKTVKKNSGFLNRLFNIASCSSKINGRAIVQPEDATSTKMRRKMSKAMIVTKKEDEKETKE